MTRSGSGAQRAPSSTRTGRITEAISVAAGVAAAFAPASLTGLAVVDALERFALATVITYLGAHARRWSWVAAGACVVVGARGPSLAIALLALVALVVESWPKRRSRIGGALIIGLLVNAAFWYPPETAPWAGLLATIGLAITAGSGLQFVRSRRRRAFRYASIALGALMVVGVVAFGVSMAMAFGHVRNGGNAAQSALASARDGDADATSRSLVEAQAEFDQAISHIEGPLTMPARLVPGLSQQVTAVQTTVQQGSRIAAAGGSLATTADYDELQYDGQLDLAQVDALQAPASDAATALGDADDALAAVLDGVLLPPLRSRIEEFTDEIADARDDAELATELLDVTPGLLGADGTRRYLVIFQTPAELRGTGGFIGSYAELTATAGEVELTRSGRIADLIFARPDGARSLDGPEDYVARYGRYRPQDFLQDATFSPHFPSSADVIAQLYEQSGGNPVDGVIGVDPTGLAALLELTGPVAVPGLVEPLSADNAVEVLTRSQYVDYPDDAERGEILTEATRVTFERLLDASLPAPRTLAETLSPAARDGHLRMWSRDRDEQQAMERVGADGSLVIPTGSDGFSVVQQNTGNNKLDAYLRRSITYLPTIDAADGSLRATMRIELHNDVPSLDLPPAVVGNQRAAPVGTNVTWLTVFTHHAVTEATVDGLPIMLGPGQEQGLNAWDTPLLQIPPGETLVLELTLEGGVDLRDGYELVILPQPVANPDRFTVELGIDGAVDAETALDQVELLDDEALTRPTVVQVDLHS